MDRISDDHLKHVIKAELDSIKPDAKRDQQRLWEIHKKISQRSGIMKFTKKKFATTVAAVVAITVMGTVTAVAAGKITGLISSTNRNDAIHSTTELVEHAKDQMGTAPKLVEAFSNGMAFKEGYISEVNGVDENNNQIISYPEMMANYGKNNEVMISSHMHQEGLAEESNAAGKQEDYKNIQLTAMEDAYLFLPPDAEPSKEDQKLQEEGKLQISYGSSEEERKVFKSVKWSENGIDYLLFTFEDMQLNTLSSMAREVIDAK
jgi:hypothetical protein